MNITAQLKNLRIAPRKVRLLSRVLIGMDAHNAQYQLRYIAKRSAHPLSKLIDSALANAHHNFGLVKDNLFIKDVVVDEGPKLKRFRAKGFGSASPLQKKTSRITVVLAEKVTGLRAKTAETSQSGAESQLSENEQEILKTKKPAARQSHHAETAPKASKNITNSIKSKLFRRKAI